MSIHSVFHVSQLRKYVGEDKLIPDVHEVELDPDLLFDQRLVAIADRRLRSSRTA